MKSAIDGRRNPVHVSTLRLHRRLSAVMTAWYTRAMLAVSSSGGNFPPVSGEGECEFTKSYEKKYLKKTSLWNFIWHIIYAGNRAAKKPCQPVKMQVCSGRAETTFFKCIGHNSGAEYRMRRLICMVVQKMAKMSTKKQKKRPVSAKYMN